MRMRAIAGWCCAATALTGIGAAHAGAWTEPEGRTEIISSFRGSVASDGFDANGHSGTIPEFRKEELDVYAQTGLSESTTLIVHSDFINYHPDAPSSGATGIGNTEIGVLQRLWHDGRQVFSVQSTMLFPGRSVITSGGIDGEVRALYGRSFALFGTDGFADAEIAWRMRSHGYASELRPEVTLGLNLDSDWQVLLQSMTVVLAGHGRSLLFQGEQAKLQLSAVYRLNDTFSLQAGGFATLAGSNTPAERGILTALWFRF